MTLNAGMRTSGSGDKAVVRRLGIGYGFIGVVLFLTACAAEFGAPSASPREPAGRFYRPDGTGPLPAMVLLPPCGGLGRYVFEWAEFLKADGYVALAVDTLSPRRVTDLCLKGTHTVHEVAGDALDALTYLRSLPFVDQNRIGVMGWSHGAMAALVATSSQPRRGGFRVLVTFYPDCGYFVHGTIIPVLLLLGESDDWTPPGQCAKVATRLQQEGRPVVWKVYPGAAHGFDNVGFGNRVVTYRGFTMRYDPAATADAKARVREFLGQYLMRAP